MNCFDLVEVVTEDTTRTMMYADFVENLTKDMGSEILNVLHAATGIAGEAGEVLDEVKKCWIYGKPIDRDKLIKELGDLNFYITMMQNALQLSNRLIIQGNVDKLSARYHEGKYSDAQAIARVDITPENTEGRN